MARKQIFVTQRFKMKINQVGVCNTYQINPNDVRRFQITKKQHSYHISLWGAGAGPRQAILRWILCLLFGKLELLQVQVVWSHPFIQSLIDFAKNISSKSIGFFFTVSKKVNKIYNKLINVMKNVLYMLENKK